MAVTFDWVNKIIDVSSGTLSMDVKADIYSEWKEWAVQWFNTKFVQAFLCIGWEPLPGWKFTPSYFFLLNGWKVRSYFGTETISVAINLYTEDGSSPFIAGGTRASFVNETTSWATTSTSYGWGGWLTPTQEAQLANTVKKGDIILHLEEKVSTIL